MVFRFFDLKMLFKFSILILTHRDVEYFGDYISLFLVVFSHFFCTDVVTAHL